MQSITMFPAGSVQTGAQLPDGDAAAACLVEMLAAQGCLADRSACLMHFLCCRRAPGVAVGQGLAIPHAHGPFVQKAGLAALTLEKPVPYGEEDAPCRLFIGLAAPAAGSAHMEQLAALMGALAVPGLPEALADAPTPQKFRELLEKNARYR